MLVEKNIRIIRNLIEALNRRDLESCLAWYDDDAIFVDPLIPDPVKGKDAIKQVFYDFLEFVPDLYCEIQNLFIGGDQVVVGLFRIRGTVRKSLFRMPDSVIGKTLELQEVEIFKLKDGKVIHESAYFDMVAMMRQLGLNDIAMHDR